MNREQLERYQILIYITAIFFGLIIGIVFGDKTGMLEDTLWPVLAVLLYTTFTQVPLVHLKEVFSDTGLIKSAIVGNFLLIPLFVWGLLHLLPDDPAIKLGVLLVLLVPCTDWFITFTHLGGGDTKHAIAFSPISLLLQIVLLPFYLWIFVGETFRVTLARQEMLYAFLGLILLPLLCAYLTERWVERSPARSKLIDRLGWLPVPLLGLVVFIISATQVNLITASVGALGRLLIVFVAFLLISGLLSRLVASVFRLPTLQGRVLAFSMGTRNSFVVLPLALALPPSYDLAVVAIVFQSLVELIGMVFYLWWVPNWLFPFQKDKSLYN